MNSGPIKFNACEKEGSKNAKNTTTATTAIIIKAFTGREYSLCIERIISTSFSLIQVLTVIKWERSTKSSKEPERGETTKIGYEKHLISEM